MTYLRTELEDYRRRNMSVMKAIDFFSVKNVEIEEYVSEYISQAIKLDGNLERDLDKLEFLLVQEAKNRHYDWVTDIVHSHGPVSMSVSACGFKKKIKSQ